MKSRVSGVITPLTENISTLILVRIIAPIMPFSINTLREDSEETK